MSTLLPEPPERRGRVEGHLDPPIVSRSLDRGPEIVLLGIEEVEPLRWAGAEELGFGRPCEGHEVIFVPALDQRCLTALDEPLQPVVADGLQHQEAGLAIRRSESLQEALVDERAQGVEHVETKLAIRVADRQRAVGRAAADEHGEPSEEGALLCVQQVVAPRDGPAQGALSLGDIAGAARQERQASVEPGEDCRRIEELGAGRSQFDREREAIEADADGRDRRCVLRVELEVGANGSRALDEERDRIEPGERLGWRHVARAGDAQRRDRILLLAPEVKDLAARRQDGQVGRGS